MASVGDLSEGNLLSKKRRHEAERANQPVGGKWRKSKRYFSNRDLQFKKPKALYIFFCQHSTWRNLTWTLKFSSKTRSWISVFFSKYEKEKCIFCQTARSRYLSTILVAVVRKTNTRRIAGEEGFWVKKKNKGFNKGFPAKEGKHRFRQSLSQSSRLRQGTVSRSTLEVGSKVGAFPTVS